MESTMCIFVMKKKKKKKKKINAGRIEKVMVASYAPDVPKMEMQL
jgi:hypothetical protein